MLSLNTILSLFSLIPDNAPFHVNIVGILSTETTGNLLITYLQSRVDCKTTGCGIHTRHILRVVDFLQLEFDTVIPMEVVQMLSDERVWLDGEVLIHLQKHEQHEVRTIIRSVQIVKAYAGAAHRRVLRRYSYELRLAIAQADARPAMPVSFR